MKSTEYSVEAVEHLGGRTPQRDVACRYLVSSLAVEPQLFQPLFFDEARKLSLAHDAALSSRELIPDEAVLFPDAQGDLLVQQRQKEVVFALVDSELADTQLAGLRLAAERALYGPGQGVRLCAPTVLEDLERGVLQSRVADGELEGELQHGEIVHEALLVAG